MSRRNIDDRERRWPALAFAQLESSRVEAVREQLRRIRMHGRAPTSLLVEGEIGSGKETLCRYVHRTWLADETFVAVDAATLSGNEAASLFERRGSAAGSGRGALFVANVDELPPRANRALEGALEGRDDGSTAIMAAARRRSADPRARRPVSAWLARRAALHLELPPLRDRRADIRAIAATLTTKQADLLSAEPPTYSGDALAVLEAYDWPGNLHELENLVARLVALNRGASVELADIPAEFFVPATAPAGGSRALGSGSFYGFAREQFSRHLVRLMMRRHGGDREKVAQALGVSLRTVRDKLRDQRP